MRVQEISGKDVHNMKARSPDLVQGCLGGASRGGRGHLLQKNAATSRILQEVPVGQMAQGTPFRCLPWPTPFQGVRRGKGGG